MLQKQSFTTKIFQGKPIFLLIGLIIFVTAGCASNERKYKKGDLTLIYRHKTTSAAELKTIELAHPLKISQKKVARHLHSLAYTHNALMSKARPIFTPEEVAVNSKVITKALNKASPNNIIYIEMNSDAGTTVVELFASGDKLNWKFNEIHGMLYSKNMLRGWGSTWHLLPQKGQALFTSQKMLGNKTWDNWLVSNLDIPENRKQKISKKKRSKKRRVKAQESAPAEINPELEEKLRFLKKLRDKDLIDDTEYKRKRKDLLDKHL